MATKRTACTTIIFFASRSFIFITHMTSERCSAVIRTDVKMTDDEEEELIHTYCPNPGTESCRYCADMSSRVRPLCAKHMKKHVIGDRSSLIETKCRHEDCGNWATCDRYMHLVEKRLKDILRGLDKDMRKYQHDKQVKECSGCLEAHGTKWPRRLVVVKTGLAASAPQYSAFGDD